MRLCRFETPFGTVRAGVLEAEKIRAFRVSRAVPSPLTAVLLAENPYDEAARLIDPDFPPIDVAEVRLLPPVETQEIWAAGVTYKRSEEARMQESQGAGQFYAKVYEADRPELFFKADARRTVGHGGAIRIRRDSTWCVPEPEFTVFAGPTGEILAYTIGDDVSCRDIEGENPLYLPQAKVFQDCCALGPVIVTADDIPDWRALRIELIVERGTEELFSASAELSQMKRTPRELVTWLFRDQYFPCGVFLMTGTGIVPPDEFSLKPGDVIRIRIDRIGELVTGCYMAEGQGMASCGEHT